MNSKTTVLIKEIEPISTLELRKTILRPHLELDDCRQTCDDDTETRHFGAYIGEEIVGVTSVYHAASPENQKFDGWRLRGMAVRETARNKDVGAKLLKTALDYSISQNGEVFWCYSRVSAIGFYEKYGFIGHGDIFDFKDVGPVKLMIKVL